jgi:sugar phosphate isomerase/epimerase
MRLAADGHPHLTYCTSLHEGESWAEIRANIARYVLAVKAKVAPDRRFGIGLRLSSRAARELEAPEELAAFRAFLDENQLYVFTINGFSFGNFRGHRPKEDLYTRDWLDEQRLSYTNTLAHILAQLLPQEPPLEGTIGTMPLALRDRIAGENEAQLAADHLLAHVAELFRIYDTTGKVIACALEPAPGCRLETVRETIDFFERHLLSKRARARLGAMIGLNGDAAEMAIRRHLGVCFDACHMAVAYEEPRDALYAFIDSGIRVPKVQISAAIKLSLNGRRTEKLRALEEFSDDIYLHHVFERCGSTLTRYGDIPEAIEGARDHDDDQREWRVHFHVPVFRRALGAFRNTHVELQKLLDTLREDALAEHLEVETYTWDLLPPEHRCDDIVEGIAQELQWTMEEMGG